MSGVGQQLCHRVAAELVQDEVGESQADHGFGHDSGGGYDADVAALVVSLLDGLARYQIRGGERPRQRRDRLYRAPHDDRLAVGDAALEAAGVVRGAEPAATCVATLDHVLNGRPKEPCLGEAEAELHALDDRDARDGAGQGAVQAPVPVDVAAKAHRDTPGHDLENAAHSVAGLASLVDAGHHECLRLGVQAPQRARLRVLASASGARGVHRHAANLDGVRPDVDVQAGEQRPRDRSRRDPRRRFARRRSLKNVPNVVEAVLRRPRQVRVPGPQPRDGSGALVARLHEPRQLGGPLVRQRLHRHHPRPVLPVAVADQQQDRRPERKPVADAGQNLGPVLLDAGASRPAAVAALAPGQVERDLVGGQEQLGGNALDRCGKRRAVRLPGGQEAEAAHVRSLSLQAGGWAGLAARTEVDRHLAQALFAGAIEFRLHDVERGGLAGP